MERQLGYISLYKGSNTRRTIIHFFGDYGRKEVHEFGREKELITPHETEKKREAHENWKTTATPIEKKLRATSATTEFYRFIFFTMLFIPLICLAKSLRDYV